VRVLIDWNITRKLCFLTDFLHVPQTTGEYYQPVGCSDRISDLQRRSEDAYKHNLRLIRADMPPEPWPHVIRVAAICPVRRWGEGVLRTVTYLADSMDYPCRIVLLNCDSALSEGECREVLGPLGRLDNVTVITPPAPGLPHTSFTSAPPRLWMRTATSWLDRA